MIVLVHGVPETGALWDKVRGELRTDATALWLPGFGCPRPTGFGATKDEYVSWVLGELERFDDPVDLVGHDWGAAITIRIATRFGDRLHSWVADGATGQHPAYEWHDFAKIWQTPGDGEQFFEDQLAAPPATIAAVFESMGVPPDDALDLAGATDATMASCILDLYRSATPNNHATWGADLGATVAPGLVLLASDDPFGDESKSRDVAALLGAKMEVTDGLGHWWALQDPRAGARAIQGFVDSIG